MEKLKKLLKSSELELIVRTYKIKKNVVVKSKKLTRDQIPTIINEIGGDLPKPLVAKLTGLVEN